MLRPSRSRSCWRARRELTSFESSRPRRRVPARCRARQVPNAAGTISFSRTRPRFAESLTYPQLLALWQRAGAGYGIPWQVLAAINKVESNFGRNMGPSSAGAIGWMQFMPSTWERWGVDANGDGVADPWNAEDAVTAAARYLAASGGQADIESAVFSYNHAQWYVDEVLQLAQLFGSGGVGRDLQPRPPPGLAEPRARRSRPGEPQARRRRATNARRSGSASAASGAAPPRQAFFPTSSRSSAGPSRWASCTPRPRRGSTDLRSTLRQAQQRARRRA